MGSHAALTSLFGKRKSNTNSFFTISYQLKKNLKIVVSGLNTIPLNPKTLSKKLHVNLKDNKKKSKTFPASKHKSSELKYSKRTLYIEIKALKKTLKKLIQDWFALTTSHFFGFLWIYSKQLWISNSWDGSLFFFFCFLVLFSLFVFSLIIF